MKIYKFVVVVSQLATLWSARVRNKTSIQGSAKRRHRFRCSCLPLLPGFSRSIHATRGPLCRALYRINIRTRYGQEALLGLTLQVGDPPVPQRRPRPLLVRLPPLGRARPVPVPLPLRGNIDVLVLFLLVVLLLVGIVLVLVVLVLIVLES